MNDILILILVFVILLLVAYIIGIQKQLKELLKGVETINQNEYQKLFIKNNRLISKLVMEINAIEERHQADVLEMNRIEQANKELLTSLSHDVRTPLTTLLGYLDALNDGVVKGEEKKQYIKTAAKKAYDLKHLVDTLFDWFKINSKELKLTMQSEDICELTRQSILDWFPILQQKNIVCEANIPEEEWFIYVDHDAYNRIINNILQNMVEHSQCKKIDFRLKQENQIIEISLNDNGIGVNKEQLSRIFERLYKGDTSRSRTSSGLGLCIAKQLVEKMNGEIFADSIEGEYTRFMIRFPMAKLF